MGAAGRPRRFKSAKALRAAWDEYKAWCGDQKVLTHDFSAKNSEFVSAELRRSVTCTIEGFCMWAGLARSAFYETYGKQYPDTVTRMKEECEVDARMKFELGVIDPKLAPLWMSRYGYSARAEEVIIPKEQAVEDELSRSLRELGEALDGDD